MVSAVHIVLYSNSVCSGTEGTRGREGMKSPGKAEVLFFWQGNMASEKKGSMQKPWQGPAIPRGSDGDDFVFLFPPSGAETIL